jgi:hypothetical protein
VQMSLILGVPRGQFYSPKPVLLIRHIFDSMVRGTSSPRGAHVGMCHLAMYNKFLHCTPSASCMLHQYLLSLAS